MNERPLTPLAIWVLVALVDSPSHMYGLRGRIYGLSLAFLVPNTNSLKGIVRLLLEEGLVVEVAQEDAKRSPYKRCLYGLTDQGWMAVRRERQRMALAVQAIDRALARQCAERN